MAKFFNKTYQHAYKRGNMVWVNGTVDNYPYARISTGKKFSKANMNWAEKNWETLLRSHWQKQDESEKQQNIPTLDEFAREHFRLKEDYVEPYTLKNNRRMYKNHIQPVFGNRKLDELRPQDIKIWQKGIIDKGLSVKTLKNIRTVLSGILSEAVENELIPRNVVKIVSLPKIKPMSSTDNDDGFGDESDTDIDPFSLEEVELLIANADGWFKNMLAVLFYTGMRHGELAGLQWQDIDFQNDLIYIRRAKKRDNRLGPTKTGKKRKINMLPPVKKALKEQYRLTGLANSFIFVNEKGKRLLNGDFNYIRNAYWKPLLRRTGLPYRAMKQTRHTFASIMLQHGEDILWVSRKMLGHSDTATTLRHYAEYIEEDNDIPRATFLVTERTTNVQEESLKLKIP